MEFIIEQQAQFTADLQKLAEMHAKAEARISHLEGAMVGVVNLLGKVVGAQEKLAEAQEKLAEAQGELAEAQKKTETAVAELAGRVDAFIVTVERYISERNGTGKNGTDRPAQ
jgi:multidrug resistance efflux pump